MPIVFFTNFYRTLPIPFTNCAQMTFVTSLRFFLSRNIFLTIEKKVTCDPWLDVLSNLCLSFWAKLAAQFHMLSGQPKVGHHKKTICLLIASQCLKLRLRRRYLILLEDQYLIYLLAINYFSLATYGSQSGKYIQILIKGTALRLLVITSLKAESGLGNFTGVCF